MIQKLIYLFHTIQYEESEENKMGTIIGEGITFDDVLLVPQYSEVTPNMIDLTTHLTKKVVLNIPMMSLSLIHIYKSLNGRTVKHTFIT